MTKTPNYNQPTCIGSNGKKYRVCEICNKDERVGGAWVDKKNPCHLIERGVWIEVRHGEPEGHALCFLLRDDPKRRYNYGRRR